MEVLKFGRLLHVVFDSDLLGPQNEWSICVRAETDHVGPFPAILLAALLSVELKNLLACLDAIHFGHAVVHENQRVVPQTFRRCNASLTELKSISDFVDSVLATLSTLSYHSNRLQHQPDGL